MPSKKKRRALFIASLAILIIGLGIVSYAFAAPTLSRTWPQLATIPVTCSSNTPQGCAFAADGVFHMGTVTVGCVPIGGQASCAVPQLAGLTSYLSVSGGNTYVIIWLAAGLPPTNLVEGEPITVSGFLQPITYSTTPGTTYPIYSWNNGAGTLYPQPSYRIANATLIPASTTGQTGCFVSTVGGTWQQVQCATAPTNWVSPPASSEPTCPNGYSASWSGSAWHCQLGTTTSTTCTNTITTTTTAGQPPLTILPGGSCYNIYAAASTPVVGSPSLILIAFGGALGLAGLVLALIFRRLV